MAVAVGANVNQYKILSRLGSGGMGEVYLAQDVRLGRKVALKLLYDDVTKNEDWVRRFEQEARAASSLNHPNIITIYEVGQSGDSLFISAEFINGQTLRQRLRQHAISVGETLDIAVQVATALVTAHAEGIVHRDIKPENVMLRGDGYVKVLDFGLAKFTEQNPHGPTDSDPNAETESNAITHPGTVMGTVSYMSPEQARGIEVDARTDIFSLGVLLYEMLSGRLPFEGATASEVIVSIIEKKHRPLARYVPDIPVELERIVGKALSKNRDGRYQTLKDMLIDMKRLRQQLELQEELTELPELPEHGSIRPVLSSGNPQASHATGAKRISSGELPVHQHQSSAEYIINGLKLHKRTALIAVALAAVVCAAAFYYFQTRPIDSIAVLPFNNLTPDPGAEHLGDDITTHVINDLSQLPGLRVMSFSAVERYRGQQVDPQTVGRELKVRAVLLGRVVRRDNSIVVSAELIDTRDGRQLWGVQRPTQFSDFMLVQEEIVGAVSDKLGVRLSADEQKHRDAEALYVKGRNAWNKRKAADIKEAMKYFEQALELRPDYAQAYAGLADCHNMLATYGAAAPRDAFPKAHDAAIKALAIDPSLAEAHAALAYTSFRGDWNWPEAEKEFKQAIRLNDNYASAHQWYANYLAAMGRFDEAIRETRRTQELDKTSLIINAQFGLIHYFAHRYDEAIAECQKTVELDPTFFVARRYLGLSYAQKGMHREAAEEFQKAIEASGDSPLMRAEYANALALAGEKQRAQAELESLIQQSNQKYISAYHIAAIYAGLQDKDGAFRWLDRASHERADWMVYLKVDPRFDGLHSDPRFAELLRRLNFR